MKRRLASLCKYLDKPHDQHSTRIKIAGNLLFVSIIVVSIIFVLTGPSFLYEGQPKIGVWFDFGIVAVLSLGLLAVFSKILKLIRSDKARQSTQEQVD